jgi:KDO2-lipid IV(A) lauroyltransferase
MKNFKDFQYRLEWLGLELFKFLVLIMGMRLSSFIFGTLFVIFAPFTKPNFLALKNLKKALPNLTKFERFKIILGMWNNLGRNFAEFVFFAGKRIKNAEKFIHIDKKSKERIIEIKNNKDGILLFLAHFGNWEVISQIALLNNIFFTVYFRNTNNPYVSNIISKIRGETGFKMIEKRENGTIKLIRSIRNHEKILMFLDQKLDAGVTVPFFNIPSKTSGILGTFSLKYNCEIYSILVVRQHFYSCHFDIKIEKFEPINTGNFEKDVIATTSKMNEKYEEWIKDRPEQWFCWVHNRWKE